MKQYLNMLQHIRDTGTDKGDRTGTGTRSVFGYQMRFDLNAGLPLLTTKKVFLRGVLRELLWFLRGPDSNGRVNTRYLKEHGVKIWDEWAGEDGDLGRIYQAQWRSWLTPDGRSIDQLQEVINRLKTNPDDRRIIVSAWNPGELDQMALPPCHALFQFYSAPMSIEERRALVCDEDLGPTEDSPLRVLREDLSEDSLAQLGIPERKLSCLLFQRSADSVLGVPFNICSYAILNMMVAHVTGHAYGEFIHTFGDLHIYSNHFEQVDEQLRRTPRPLPRLKLNPAVKDLFDFRYEDFTLEGYDPYPAIKAPIAV